MAETIQEVEAKIVATKHEVEDAIYKLDIMAARNAQSELDRLIRKHKRMVDKS